MPTSMTRRRILRFAAGSGVLGVAGVSALAESPSPPRRGANEELRLAIIGIHQQGRQHISYHGADKRVRIATLCDVDESLFSDRVKVVPGDRPPTTQTDLRRVLDDKDIDCVSIATPNHWHSLAAIWACQAGKDVYVEKPLSQNFLEGRRLIEAARRYDRIVQHGTHMRACESIREGIQRLREGLIGDIFMARAFHYQVRGSIGVKSDQPSSPSGVNYDLWLGPAPVRPFNPNRFHYEWHWNWDYGDGEIGNNGVHLTDLAIQGLDKQETHPIQMYSAGGRFIWNDQGQTPNVQTATYRYADGKVLEVEMRNLASNTEAEADEGVLFYGSKGYMLIAEHGYRTTINGQPGPKRSGGGAHTELARNFHDAVFSRRSEDLWAPVEHGHYAAALCHLANISYRLGRSLTFDPQAEKFPEDREANALLTREYRKPFIIPEKV